MSTENDQDRDKMGLFVQGRSVEIDLRIAETRERLDHSRRFLENVLEGERRTRQYLTDLIAGLESQVERLNKDRKEQMAADNGAKGE